MPSELVRFSTSYFLLYSIYGISSPYLQVLIRGLGYGEAAIGMMLGLFELAGIAGPLAVARFADRSGRYRSVLLAAALGSVVALFPLSSMRGLASALVAVCLLSVGLKSLIPIMDSAALSFSGSSDQSAGLPPQKAKREGLGSSYGFIRSLGSTGFVAMVLALKGFHLESARPRTIALWLAGSVMIFAASLLLLPGKTRSAGPTHNPSTSTSPGKRMDPVLLLGLVIFALSRMSMAPIGSFMTLYVSEELKSDAASLLWALAAASEIPIMLVSGRIVRALGPMRSVAISCGAVALRLLVYALVPTLGGAVVGQALHSVCFGLFHPAAISFVGTRVPPERRVEGMAIYMAFGFGLPTFLGSALGGLVLEAWGYRALFASFSLAALLALGFYALVRRRFNEAPLHRRSA